jgi:hypothetical protein
MHQEYFVSHKKDDNAYIKNVNKFIVNASPRIMLIPSISVETGPLLDFTLVKSPA